MYVSGGEEGARQLRGIATQLEEALGTIGSQLDDDGEDVDQHDSAQDYNENNSVYQEGVEAIFLQRKSTIL